MFRLSINISIELGNTSKQKGFVTSLSWYRLRHLVKKHSQGMCHYCGDYAPDGQADHVLPLSRGGTDSIDNLVWACKSCNSSKGNKTIEEWKQSKTISVEEEQQVLDLFESGKSVSVIASRVYGSKGGNQNQQVKEILQQNGKSE